MHIKWQACKTAFPYTLPVLAGYLFLGLAYGIYMNQMGFSFWYPLLMSVTIFAGSMQFVAVNLLVYGSNPLSVLLLTLMVNARHLFYGISMLEKYRGLGLKKYYLIFGLTDETFSIHCAIKPPKGIDRGWFLFFITFLNQCYWVIASTLGAILGSFLHFNTEGIEFVMTALFVVIFTDQWLSTKQHLPAIIGIVASVLCLICFSGEHFMIPAMLLIMLSLTACKRKLEGKGKTA